MLHHTPARNRPSLRLRLAPVLALSGTLLFGAACTSGPGAEAEVVQRWAEAQRARRLAAGDGRQVEAARCCLKMLELRPTPAAAYDCACHFVLAGSPDSAFFMLARADTLGYRHPDQARSDPDLASLHGDPRWEPILQRFEENRRRWEQSLHPGIHDLFLADQADRRGDWSGLPGDSLRAIQARDSARRERLARLLDSGAARTADDYVHAAFLFQHGGGSAGYRRARELALRALELDPAHPLALWLSAAAEDRWLQSVGKPQIWGTQMLLQEGRWTLEPYDTAAVSDAQRIWRGILPLARQRQQIRELNGADSTP